MNKLEKVQRLTDLQDKIIEAYVANSILRGAEDYAPLYRKYPKLFKQLVKSEIATDKGMRKYFKGLSERLVESLDWNEYQRQRESATSGASATSGVNAPRGADYKAANILDYLVKAFWEDETLVLKINLTGTLIDAIEAGGLYTQEDLHIDIGWSRNEAPVIEFLNKYTLQLSKSLTQVSSDRVLSALKLSIDNGEDRDGAIKRINEVVRDVKRSTTIAQTESVRGFSSGRMQVAKEIGADRKQWRTAGAKDYCLTLEGMGVVPLTYRYLTEQGGKIDKPPAHPNCRCGIQIFMPDEKV